MQICHDESELAQYIGSAVDASQDHPLLVEKFLEDAIEVDVDAVADGETVVIGGIMEHIEEAGVHSGDSASVLPPTPSAKSSWSGSRTTPGPWPWS